MRSMNTPGSNGRNPYYAASQAGTYKSGSMGGVNTSYQPAGGGSSGAYYGGGGNASAPVGSPAYYLNGGGGGGGYSGGGYSSGGYGGGSDVAAEYQRKIDEANAKNEQRYAEINSGFDGLKSRTMGSLATGNSQAIEDINRASAARQGALGQDLTSRGLTGSTLQPTLSAGLDRERVRDVNRENFNYEQQKRNADMALTQNQLGFQERRNDIAPDLGQLLALSQAYGNGGGGSGGGYGTPLVNFGGLGGFGALASLGSMPSYGGFGGYGGSSIQSNYDGGMSQQQIMKLQKKNNYNSGYSNLGNSGGGYGGYQNSVMGNMPDFSNYA